MGGFALIIVKDSFAIEPNAIFKIESYLRQRGNALSTSLQINQRTYVIQTLSSHTKVSGSNNSYCFEAIGDYIILSDARLDNRDDLNSKFQINAEHSDARTILEIYLKINNKVFEEIEGPFSFVIYNKTNNKVIAGRDIFGQKPFFYSNNSDFFIACSEIDPIFFVGLKKIVNKKKLAQLIIQDFKRDSQTIYRNINKLHGGSYLEFYKKDLKVNKYFNFPDKVTYFRDYKKTVDDFYEIFKTVIKGQIDSTSLNVGSTLSGGLDSSSISLIVDKYKRDRFHTYSVLFNGLNKKDFLLTDEKKYIDEVLKNINSKHSFINLHLKKDGPIIDLERKYSEFQFPFLIINGYIHQSLYEKCNEEGVNFLFDGLFGDEIISHGTYRLGELVRSGRFIKFLLEVWHLKKNNVIQSIKSPIKIYLLSPLKTKINNFFIFDSSRKIKNNKYEDLSNILNKQHKFEKIIKEYKYSLKRDFISEHKEQIYFYKSGIIEHSLEQLDFMATRLNVEPIYPFLDKRIVSFCMRVPTKFKLNNGVTRLYFRESMKEIFPKKIYERQTKSNISPFTKYDINNRFVKKLNHIEKSDGLVSEMVDFEEIKNKKTGSGQLSSFNIISLHLWLEAVFKQSK